MVDKKTSKTDTKAKKPAPAKNKEHAGAQKAKEADAPTVIVKSEGAEKKSNTAALSKTKTPKGSMITIRQTGSPIRRDGRQKLYLKSLGLGKLNRERQIVDNPSTRGLLDKVKHMVLVVEQ